MSATWKASRSGAPAPVEMGVRTRKGSEPEEQPACSIGLAAVWEGSGRLLAAGCWLLAAGCWLLAAGCFCVLVVCSYS
jgi:hypothetical protein